MADKVIVYSKQTNEPSVPITTRVDWLPDGSIKPRLYWMPDGSCYAVRHVYEMTPLAYVKDRGEGIRFKVRAEAIVTPEVYSDHRFAQHETYLYLADNWFCGKNLIDGRYNHAGKEFILVTLDIFPNGAYELIYFKARGTRYMVEKTIAVEPRGSFHAGGIGIWHKVEARLVNTNDDEDPDPHKSVRRLAGLFWELNKWFIVKAS